jgi:chromosome segregation ATPase
MASRGEEAHEHEIVVGEDETEDVSGSLVRRVLAHSQTPEERLELLLNERRREFEEQAARLQEAVDDLERREQLLRDSRASVERLLRVRTSELDSKELEQTELARELEAREERLASAEAELAERRSELGAVELRREAVEQRERALAEREEQSAALEARLLEAEAEAQEASAALAFVPGAAYRLVEIEPGKLDRGGALTVDEQEYSVVRIGPSPLPGDDRRCAYLVRGAREASSGGSS